MHIKPINRSGNAYANIKAIIDQARVGCNSTSWRLLYKATCPNPIANNTDISKIIKKSVKGKGKRYKLDTMKRYKLDTMNKIVRHEAERLA